MKTLLILLIVSAAFADASILKKLEQFKELGYDILEHPFGQHQVKISESETHIFDTGLDIRQSPTLYQEFLESAKKYSRQDLDDAVLHCSKGDSPDYFKWAASPMGVIGNEGKSTWTISLITNEDTCYANISLTYTETAPNAYTLEFVGSKRRGLTCSNIIQISTAETMHLPILMTYANGKHTVNVQNQSAAQMESVHKWGIHIYQTCDKVANLVGDLTMTLSLFVGGLGLNPDGQGIWSSKPTEAQTKANVEYIQRGTLFQWEERQPIFVDLRETQIKSGDFIIITRMDGVDQLIQWGAGGHVGHTCVVLEVDGEMMVVESQDGWYWPKHGIQRNTWAQWKQWALNADFSVAILPLSDEKQKIMDANLDKAVAFFKKMEGYPYGYHNFLFGWLDDTAKNIPPITTMDYLYVLFSQLEKIIPGPVTSIMGEALNIRLGTKGLTLAQIANTAWDRGMTIDELFSIPENDDWVYSDGPSMVCSAFVTGVYKAAGLFEGVDIQATEFTPRDVYQLDFWNKNAKRPLECQAADPDLPYCQVMGSFKMKIFDDKWSTVKPYNNMYERCPSMTPLFERDTSYPDGC